MSDRYIISNESVAKKYLGHPDHVQKKINEIRKLIIDVAYSDSDIDYVGEELKWGEPSFVTKSSGSTFRIDWKEKHSESISIFFNCRTKLIATFKEMYPDDFEFEGNREIRLALSRPLQKNKLKKCFEMAFKYNLIKSQL